MIKRNKIYIYSAAVFILFFLNISTVAAREYHEYTIVFNGVNYTLTLISGEHQDVELYANGASLGMIHIESISLQKVISGYLDSRRTEYETWKITGTDFYFKLVTYSSTKSGKVFKKCSMHNNNNGSTQCSFEPFCEDAWEDH